MRGERIGGAAGGNGSQQDFFRQRHARLRCIRYLGTEEGYCEREKHNEEWGAMFHAGFIGSSSLPL